MSSQTSELLDCQTRSNSSTVFCDDQFTASTSLSYLESFDPVVFNIKFWEIKDDDGELPDGVQLFNFQNISLKVTADLNKYYNEYNIFFKYKGIDEIRSDILMDENMSNTDISQEISSNNNFPNREDVESTDAIDVYVAYQTIGGSASLFGRRYTVSRPAFKGNPKTNLHELAHCFGILHTHEFYQGRWYDNPNLQECEKVTRNPNDDEYNADIAGDRTVDTAAAPDFRNEHGFELFLMEYNRLMATGEYTHLEAVELAQDVADIEKIPFLYYENCEYIGTTPQCEGINQYELFEEDLQNLMSYKSSDCNENYFTIGQAIRMREAIDVSCSTTLREAINVDGIASLYEPYYGAYYVAGRPFPDSEKPVFQPGFDYEFVSCDGEYPYPAPYSDTSFSYNLSNVVVAFDKDETDYASITHPNYSAIRILQLENGNPVQPRKCYNNNLDIGCTGAVTTFHDGIINGNYTTVVKDSTAINDQHLIVNLPNGLYVIDTNYCNGQTDQTVVQKGGD